MKKSLKIILVSILCVFCSVLGVFASILVMRSNSHSSYDSKEYYSEGIVEDTDRVTSLAESVESYVEDNTEGVEKNNSLIDSKTGKIVYFGEVSIGSEDVKKVRSSIETNVSKYEAFIEEMSETITSFNYTIRIPKQNFIAFYESLSEVDGTISNSNIQAHNYTKTYIDNERRIDILNTEYGELKELMDSADTVEDILSIRDRLSDITYELESLTSDNSEIDDLVDYATLRIDIYKVGNQEIKDTPFSTEVKDALTTSIDILKDVALILLSIWWVIVLIILAIIFVPKIYRAVKRRRSQKLEPSDRTTPKLEEEHNEDK